MKDLNKIKEEKKQPQATEALLVNPATGDSIRLRNDGCIVIQSGKTNLVIDGTTGQITLDGKSIVNNANSISNYNSPGNSFVEGKQFNPEWIEGNPLKTVITNVIKDELTKVSATTDPLTKLVACFYRLEEYINKIPLVRELQTVKTAADNMLEKVTKDL